MKNLYVIDGLINAYALRKIESFEASNFDILVTVNTNIYDLNVFIRAIKNIIFPMVCEKMFITHNNDWAYRRNWHLRKGIEREIVESGLTDDIIQGYSNLYLNPFTSGVGAVMSTKGIRTQYLSHGSFDVFRFKNFYYHAAKLWIRTGILIQKGSSCYGMVDLKHKTNDLINIFNLNKSSLTSGANFKQQYSPDIFNEKLLAIRNERLLLLLWTQRDEGSNRDFNKQIIQFNLELIRAFFDRHPGEKGKLVCLIKCYRHFDRGGFDLFQKQLNEFEVYFKDVIFFNDVSFSSTINYIPVELLVDALSPVYMIGSSSSALWNCAGLEGLTVYQAFLYKLEESKFSKYGQRVYKKLFKSMKTPPQTLL